MSSSSDLCGGNHVLSLPRIQQTRESLTLLCVQCRMGLDYHAHIRVFEMARDASKQQEPKGGGEEDSQRDESKSSEG